MRADSLTADWANAEGEALLAALVQHLENKGASVTSPRWLRSHTRALVAMAGALAIKVPARSLAPAERARLVNLDLKLAKRLAPEIRIALSRLDWRADGVLSEWDCGKEAVPVLMMRRMPPEADLLGRCRARGVGPVCGERLGHLFRAFHRACPGLAGSEATAAAAVERRTLSDDLEALQTIRARGPMVDLLTPLADFFGTSAEDAHRDLEARAELGLIRDIHGDAHMENIWFIGENPTLVDPMPSDRRRRVDVLRDVAKVMLELRRLGAHEAEPAFLKAYGLSSSAESNLLRYFMARQMLGDLIALETAGGKRPPHRRGPFILGSPQAWKDEPALQSDR